MRGVEVEFRERGIHLPQIDLWLDCTDDCWSTWISHGHSDHANGLHGKVFGTPETLRFYRARVTERNPGEPEPEYIELQFGEPVEYHGARLTAFPASHILGAAQLLVEYRDTRLVYTGDIKLKPPLCGRATEVVPCDRLIVESTFGLPIYRFLGRSEARERIAAFARECLEDGVTPVFVGYALGRGQEIAHVLCEASVPVAIHGSIARFIPEYEAAGYCFRDWQPYQNRDTEGKALVVVPDFRNYLEASGKNIRVAYVSGWAALDNARSRAGAEVLVPYSDHAGFDELLALVEGASPKHVDVVHGYTDVFARILRDRGYEARAASAAEVHGATGMEEG